MARDAGGGRLQAGRSSDDYRVRLEFAQWIARMETPRRSRAAIRVLQAKADAEVVAPFRVRGRRLLHLDTMLMTAEG